MPCSRQASTEPPLTQHQNAEVPSLDWVTKQPGGEHWHWRFPMSPSIFFEASASTPTNMLWAISWVVPRLLIWRDISSSFRSHTVRLSLKASAQESHSPPDRCRISCTPLGSCACGVTAFSTPFHSHARKPWLVPVILTNVHSSAKTQPTLALRMAMWISPGTSTLPKAPPFSACRRFGNHRSGLFSGPWASPPLQARDVHFGWTSTFAGTHEMPLPWGRYMWAKFTVPLAPATPLAMASRAAHCTSDAGAAFEDRAPATLMLWGGRSLYLMPPFMPFSVGAQRALGYGLTASGSPSRNNRTISQPQNLRAVMASSCLGCSQAHWALNAPTTRLTFQKMFHKVKNTKTQVKVALLARMTPNPYRALNPISENIA
mmetsp:Transcript_104964/g.321555  ORF Transcript_104964/g.321555 Transcript_104964/m.321555 type:complete len:374 (+) Transcript_104964:660-1781(+)